MNVSEWIENDFLDPVDLSISLMTIHFMTVLQQCVGVQSCVYPDRQVLDLGTVFGPAGLI